ncbi:MAG: carboxylase [Candidatus Aminicenantes bacterium]|nr:carboxylase [Candidatus Aminicenantes bacterium]
MAEKILIRDLTLRDGQQSQLATRMNQEQVDRLLPLYRTAGFYAMEVWGGAVPDSIMRYLDENPWQRLEKIKSAIGSSSKLTALSRGRNLFGYNPYPDEVIEGFCRNAVQSGIDIMRIFDALNDIDNMKSTIRYVKLNQGSADCAVCYTVDPKFTWLDRVRALLAGKPAPGRIFTVDYFVTKAEQLAGLGADMITIKDMAGLIDPATAGKLIRALKKNLAIPVNLHTHCTPGFGLASVLMAMLNGVDIVDTVILNFSGGPAAPAFELVQIFADKLGLETGVDRRSVAAINKLLLGIRAELAQFDQYKMFPRPFDLAADKLPAEIDLLFDQAIAAAKAERISELLQNTQAIENYFNFPAPDDIVRVAQIPGGMYSNMLAQLQQAKLEHLLGKVLQTVPRVRLDAGCPPLVTPTSQIVGVQAVNCVIDQANGKPFYTSKSTQFINLVKGSYGKTPVQIDPAFREKITGTREETPYDTSQHRKQDNPVLAELGGVHLAKGEKEELLLELFPTVAGTFLKKLREKEFKENQAQNPQAPEKDADDEKWENLSEYA